MKWEFLKKGNGNKNRKIKNYKEDISDVLKMVPIRLAVDSKKKSDEFSKDKYSELMREISSSINKASDNGGTMCRVKCFEHKVIGVVKYIKFDYDNTALCMFLDILAMFGYKVEVVDCSDDYEDVDEIVIKWG